MYDLHCHILPEVDDGPATWNESMELAQALVNDGITTVAATPHGPGSHQCFFYNAEDLRNKVMRLREYLQRRRIGLQVVLGTELVLAHDLINQLKAATLLPYGDSRAILLEAPADFLSDALEHAIYTLQLAQYRVVLAHPERTQSVQENPNSLLPLIERGVLVQVTAASLTGYHGERLQSVATQLLNHGMVHLLATDAHAATGKRAPQLQAAVEAATTLVGPEKAQALVYDIPERLLNNRPLPAPEPLPVVQASAFQPRRRLWFLGRT